MSWSYTYDPHLWPALIVVAMVTYLGWYSWQRRSIPAAKPFAIICLFAWLWAAGSALQIAAVDFSSRVFWIKFQAIWHLPTATALPCFVLSYAGLSRWLTRRNLLLLSIPSVLALLLVITNDYHHLIWTGFQDGEYIIQFFGSANWVFVASAFILSLINIILLLWLAIRLPHRRWPMIIMICGQIVGLGFYLLGDIYTDLLNLGERTFFVLGSLAAAYGIALFRYRVLDPVPLARSAVIDQMREGMLVLDLQKRIVDLNSAAARILGRSVSNLREHNLIEVLPANLDLPSQSDKINSTPVEISLRRGKEIRYLRLNITSLVDKHDQVLGHLLLLYDITEEKKAHARVLEQQQVVATLQERERLARELHDSTGQVLGYVNLQAETIRKWLQAGKYDKVESLIARVAEVAKGAHTDIRESILSLKASSSREWSFLPVLRQYLNEFQSNYDIHTELAIQDGLRENLFKPDAEVQLLRVIQEALTNARKHSKASLVRVTIEHEDGLGRITITDNGSGFNPQITGQEPGRHFGLAFMNERMAQISGFMKIDSQPGAGTVIKLEAPIWDGQEKTE
jgi:PAS domain S-box-containing protein